MPKSMPQAVVDTNVLIRVNITKKGSDCLVYRAFLDGKFDLLFSERLVKELKRVLRYPRIYSKYGFNEEKISAFIRTIFVFGKLVFSPKKVKICRDPDDDEIFSIALAVYSGKPVYIISGDEDILSLRGKIKGIRIMKPREFLKSIDNGAV